jgi:hypothetical protein
MKKVMISMMFLLTIGMAASAQTTQKTKTNSTETTQKTKAEGSSMEEKDKTKATSSVPQKMHNAVRPHHKKHQGTKTKQKTSGTK